MSVSRRPKSRLTPTKGRAPKSGKPSPPQLKKAARQALIGSLCTKIQRCLDDSSASRIPPSPSPLDPVSLLASPSSSRPPVPVPESIVMPDLSDLDPRSPTYMQDVLNRVLRASIGKLSAKAIEMALLRGDPALVNGLLNRSTQTKGRSVGHIRVTIDGSINPLPPPKKSAAAEDLASSLTVSRISDAEEEARLNPFPLLIHSGSSLLFIGNKERPLA